MKLVVTTRVEHTSVAGEEGGETLASIELLFAAKKKRVRVLGGLQADSWKLTFSFVYYEDCINLLKNVLDHVCLWVSFYIGLMSYFRRETYILRMSVRMNP